MTGTDESGDAGRGRHGGGDGEGGLSAAELIARSRAAAASDGSARHTRSSRRRASEPDVDPANPATDAPADAQASNLPPTDARPAGRLEAVPDPPVQAGPAPAATRTEPLPNRTEAVPNRPEPVQNRTEPIPNRPEPVARLVASGQADPVEELIQQAASPAVAPTRHLSVVDSHPASAAAQLPTVSQLVPPPARRGGRNLPAAIGVGVGLGALIIATLTIYRPSFVFVIAIAVAIGVYEIVTAIATVEARPPLVPLLAGTAAMAAAAWFRGPDGLVGAMLLTALGITIWRLADGAAGYLRDIAAGYLVALYVPFLAGFAVLMTHAGDGTARIIIFILTVVCSDTGGYAAGVFLGKHPMAPTVSPKKSWEGLAGSLVAGSIGGLLMMTLCFHHHWWQGVLYGLALVVTATLGDLGESMIKRDLGLKDMGKLLPGHGGIMDRLDSLLPCAPVGYLLLAAFLR